ncbi:MAG: hypothetical protein AB7V08_08185 [Elusimicrobiales bacterium]
MILLTLLGALLALLPLSAAAGPTEAAVKDLYSENAEMRGAAQRALSAVKPGPETEQVLAAFRSELACAGKKPRPAKCHDPEFVRGVLLAAGALAKKDDTLPWNFLVGLASGRSSTDGSFFQDKSKLEDQDFRGEDYYSPAGGDGRRAELQGVLDEVIKAAGILPSCDWPLEKVRARAKKAQALGGYQVYSYSRDYSGAGLQEQYGVIYAQNWIYRGEERAYCGPASRIGSYGKAGLLAAEVTDLSGEEPAYSVALYDLAAKKALCSYSVTVDSTEAVESFDYESLGPEKLVQALFDLDKGVCRPKKLKGYLFTPN